MAGSPYHAGMQCRYVPDKISDKNSYGRRTVMEEEQIRETIKYPCRKCLLREMDKNAYMENLYAYIDRIEEDSKADKAVYEDRLLYVRNVNI